GRPFVDFAAEVGIINGYPMADGGLQFRPENPVSREESMQMIYKTVKNSGLGHSPDQTLSFKYEEQLISNQIAPWAWECVAYGLEYGILEKSELAGFRTDFGAPVPATRELAARWTAKALNRPLLSATSLNYIDKEQIEADNIFYVDLLKRMSIMVGDNTGRFNPKSNIKRVEFAVICTKVYDLASSPYDSNREIGYFQGTIIGVNDQKNKIYLSMTDGSIRVIDLKDNVSIVLNGEITYNGLDKIQSGRDVIIAWGPFNQVHINTKALLGEGTVLGITSLDGDSKEISIRLSDGAIVYYFLVRETFIQEEPKKGQDVMFIADGVKIIEIKKQ
ncbi:MAG: S-layer homology domain-containing protein, partial [Eubacteriales bacterium]|nr:S-layer homology domain-containing protein [Eubacteriales bacterium]